MNSSKYSVMIFLRYIFIISLNTPSYSRFKTSQSYHSFPVLIWGFFFFGFFADLSIPVIESTVCPPHYMENNGRCYRFFQDIPLDWESADHFCTLDNGTLASISTIYRFGFIQALSRHVNLTTYWIGLRRSNVWKMCELWYIFVTCFHVEHYNAHEFIDSIELY